MSIAYIITNDSISATINGRNYNVLRTNAHASKIIDAIIYRDYARLPALFDAATAIRKYTLGYVTVKGNDVYYKGEQVQNAVVTKIIGFLEADLPVEPLLKFLGNLMENPSKRAVDQLYTFLEHRGLPITEDGCFLAYKAIRSNWMDKYSGTVSNHLGAVIQCDRNKVDDDPEHDCSYGYHAGSLDYVEGFANGSTDIKVIVKINPKDVICIPKHDARKLRCCKYKVVQVFDGTILPDTYWGETTTSRCGCAGPKRDSSGRFATYSR